MPPINGSTDAVDRYWESVTNAAQSPNLLAAARASELLRLRQRADLFSTLIPTLPPLTVDTVKGGGRQLGVVDPLGGWGQGLAIRLRESRVDPFLASYWDNSASGLDSLIWGNDHPLRCNAAGEQQRQLEADLMLLQLMVKARLHQLEADGVADARVDLSSYGGCGKVRAQLCNQIWPKALELLGLQIPVVPVRHGRTDAADTSNDPWAIARPSCQGWPVTVLRQTHDPRPDPTQDPPTIRVGGEGIPVPLELWAQWCCEQQALDAAVRKALPGLMEAIQWPTAAAALLVDEMPEQGGDQVAPPAAAAPVAMSSKINLNYNAAEALQAVEALFTKVDQERGTKLWPDFLEIAAARAGRIPASSREQTVLEIDLDAPAAVEPEPESGPEGPKSAAVIKCRDTSSEGFVEEWRPLLDGIADLVPWINQWSLNCGGVYATGLDSRLTRKGSTPYPAKGSPCICVDWQNGGVLESVSIAKTAMGPFDGHPDAPKEWSDLRCDIATRLKRLGLRPIKEPSITDQAIAAITEAVTNVLEQAAEEPSESQLRKLPEWPAGRSNSQSTGQRMRLTKEQIAALEVEIQTRITAGMKQIKIAAELAPWCGQSEKAVQTRVRKLQRGRKASNG